MEDKKRADEMFGEVLDFAKELKTKKSKLYGESWRKRGFIGALLNLERKTDRLGPEIQKALERGEMNYLDELYRSNSMDTIIDTLIDTMNYSALCYAYLKEKCPERIAEFEREVMK